MKFNIESPIFQFLSTLVDFVILNLVFLITCIPIITIGPALSALYTVTMKEARKEHSYMIKSYVYAFKSNFKSGICLFFIYFIIGSILLFSLSFWLNMQTSASSIVLLIIIAAIIIYLFSFMYTFALNAGFENSIKQTIKNSILISLANIGMTFGILLIPAIAIFLCYLMPTFKIMIIFFGFSFLAYCESFLFIRVFNKYIPNESTEN